MRVALVVAGPWPALRGSQVLVGHLALGLRERGHVVDVITYGRRLGRRPGLGPSRPFLDAWLALRLAWHVRRHRVEVMHAHNYEAALAALAVRSLSGCPLVYHGHCAMAEELPTYVTTPAARRLLARVGAWLDSSVPRRAEFCIAVTDELGRHLEQGGVGPAALACIPPAGLPGEIRKGSPAAPGAVPRVGRDGDGARPGRAGDPLVCYAGNLDGYQNLEFLLGSFALVRDEMPAARLQLVTHADAQAHAARLAARGLGAGVEIVVARSYDEVRERLASAAVAVSPRAERSGFPMKLLNYMAAGKAIVACAGSAKGLHEGETARVVPDGDAGAFAAAVVALLRDPGERTRLGRAAHAAVDAPGAWEHVLDRIESIYRHVAAPRPAPARVPVTERSA